MNTNLAQYKDLYIKTATKYVRDLQDGINKLQNNSADPAVIDSMYIAAHSLGSQSLVMGFTSTGQCCRSIEHVLYANKTKQTMPSASLQALLQPTIAKIAKSLQTIEESEQELSLEEQTQQLAPFEKV